MSFGWEMAARGGRSTKSHVHHGPLLKVDSVVKGGGPMVLVLKKVKPNYWAVEV